MIRINNFLHRQELLEITRRWFHHRLEEGDLASLKELINYNSIWLGRVSREFAGWIFGERAGHEVAPRSITSKGQLKDLLVQNPHHRNDRITKLCKRYQEHPERYYRETPFLGLLYAREHEGEATYLGSTRIKRVRRIAEKGARRISDYIFEQIQHRTHGVVHLRAHGPGQPRTSLTGPAFASPEEMLDEIERAERRIGMEIQRGRLFQERFEFVLEDVLGVKVIAEDKEQPQIVRLLEQNPRCDILEIEQHRGRYNATNVIFRYRPDIEKLLSAPLSDNSLRRLAARGMSAPDFDEAFRNFVRSGESSVHIEIIVTNFEEMLESEIGRSMHEERLMRQRVQAYRGHLSRNVSYLMEFIFACGISPCTEIDDIPIQVWNQYVPDYFDEVIKRLFKIPMFREVE